VIRRLIAIGLVLVIAFGFTSSALAQSYSFSLDKEVVDVYWNSDGTMSLDYRFTFTNQPGAHVIDFVDVGLPNAAYSYPSITADVDGNPVAISTDYQGSGTGVAVDMGSHAIQPGDTGTVHVYVGTIRNVLFNDDQDETYASADFAPTWFGSQYVIGSTDLSVTFHLPPGVRPEEPRWHEAPAGFPSEPQTGLDSEGRITYTWQSAAANGYTTYLFGASFPRSYVPADAIYTAPPRPPIDPGTIIGLACLGFFALMFLGIPTLVVIAGRRRKLKYLAPRIAIEGHGVKRGLTAVEAAILLEQPLDKVMTMILFSVVKKGAAKVTRRQPLTVEAIVSQPEELRDYEIKFVRAFKEEDSKARRQDLHEMAVKLIKSVSEKMKGFSRRETIEYYKRIVETAWEQVQGDQTPQVQREFFEQNLEWTMLDKDYDDRSRRVFRGPVYVPNWWGGYDPTYTPRPISSGRTAAPAPSRQPGGTSLPQLPGADFAASVVTGVQTFSQSVVGNITDFTSRVTNVTNPPPKPTSSGGSSHSGGGCACACACAGCACACAGGGR